MGYPKFGKTLGELAGEIREVNVKNGWRPADGGPGDNRFGELIALVHSELSEALEAYRDHRLADASGEVEPLIRDGKDLTEGRLPKPEGVGSELADVVIRVIDMCDMFGLDLEREIVRKVAYNRTRPWRHGNRTLYD